MLKLHDTKDFKLSETLFKSSRYFARLPRQHADERELTKYKLNVFRGDKRFVLRSIEAGIFAGSHVHRPANALCNGFRADVRTVPSTTTDVAVVVLCYMHRSKLNSNLKNLTLRYNSYLKHFIENVYSSKKLQMNYSNSVRIFHETYESRMKL
jgi:hypothetical protein